MKEIMTRMRLKSFRTIILCGFLAFAFLLYCLYSIRIQKNLDSNLRTTELERSANSYVQISNDVVYTIVIDAGSTGSRIHVFRLKHNKEEISDKFDAELIREDLFIRTEPGLSSYTEEPEQASQSIKPLLDKAMDAIPEAKRAMTYLTLKATAGLRLVSDAIADRILKNIKKLFDRYPFKQSSDPEIMDGKLEGIYSWLTLNYALNAFRTSNESAICALDLGGGSTQITFIPTDQVSFKKHGDGSIVDFKLADVGYRIYSKSFLGLGLKSARLRIFEADSTDIDSALKNKKILTSVCLKHKHKFKWQHQGVEYTVVGSMDQNKHSFNSCYESVLKTIGNKLNVPAEVRYKQIFAFSFFFDILKRAEVITNDEGHSVEINIIKQNAESYCNPSQNKTSEPFLCMDMTFIYAILTQGYGLPDEKTIHVHQKVNNMEISWALGAAFDLID